MAKFFDIFSSILGSIGGNNDKGKKIDTNTLLEQKKAQDDFNKKTDANNDALVQFNRALEKLNIQLNGLNKGSKEYADTEKEILDIIDKKNSLVDSQTQLNKENENSYKKLAEATGNNKNQVKAQVDALSESSKKLGLHHLAINAITDALGLGNIELKKYLELEFILADTMALAAKQVVELNSKLVELARTTSGVITRNTIGFDNSGNNAIGGKIGSLSTVAETNNLQVEEFLNTFKAFSDGQIFGAASKIQESQEDLQNYGIEVGRVSKLYGVSSDTLANLGRNLSQNFGVKIKDIGNIFEKGAETAYMAGVSVQKFFDNMQQIADMAGSLYVRGGVQGLEKAAGALSKLGLGAQSLEHVNQSITDFGSLIDKQNRSAALNFANYAAATSRIFAMNYNGNSSGALTLQQTAFAKDIVRNGYQKNGQVTAPGIEGLKSLGMGDEEIKSVGRLIREQKAVGVSFEQLSKETDLTVSQLARKRKFEEDNMTFGEKVKMMWAKIKGIVIDPIASILGPLLNITLSILSGTFSTLYLVLKPIIGIVEIFGKALSKVADVVSTGINWFESVLSKVGIGSNTSDLVDKVSSILAWLIGIAGTLATIKLVLIANQASSQIKDFLINKGTGLKNVGEKIFSNGRQIFGKKGVEGDAMSVLNEANGLGGKEVTDKVSQKGISGFLGRTIDKIGGKTASGLGGAIKFLGKNFSPKGLGIGMLAGPLAGIAGNAVGGRAGNNISTIGQYAATGAMFGPWGAAIGAGIGAIVANWDVIKPVLQGIWDWTKKIVNSIFDLGNYLFKPLHWLQEHWPNWLSFGLDTDKINEQLKKMREDAKNKDKNNVKIASIGTGGINGGATIEQQQAVLKHIGISSKEITEEKEKQMNRTFSGPPVQVILHNHNDLMAKGMKQKWAGH